MGKLADGHSCLNVYLYVTKLRPSKSTHDPLPSQNKTHPGNNNRRKKKKKKTTKGNQQILFSSSNVNAGPELTEKCRDCTQIVASRLKCTENNKEVSNNNSKKKKRGKKKETLIL